MCRRRPGIPNQVLELMLRIRSELPPLSPRGRLAVKTYLKMILILLVNRYSSYAGTVETFQRQQRDLDQLLPLFRFLGDNCGKIQVKDACRICGMSESNFTSFFKRVTGLSFMKYLNHYRVERSQVLLANTDEPMASISHEDWFLRSKLFRNCIPSARRYDPCRLSQPLPDQRWFSPLARPFRAADMARKGVLDGSAAAKHGRNQPPTCRTPRQAGDRSDLPPLERIHLYRVRPRYRFPILRAVLRRVGSTALPPKLSFIPPTHQPKCRGAIEEIEQFRNWCRPKRQAFSWFSLKENHISRSFSVHSNCETALVTAAKLCHPERSEVKWRC